MLYWTKEVLALNFTSVSYQVGLYIQGQKYLTIVAGFFFFFKVEQTHGYESDRGVERVPKRTIRIASSVISSILPLAREWVQEM